MPSRYAGDQRTAFGTFDVSGVVSIAALWREEAVECASACSAVRRRGAAVPNSTARKAIATSSSTISRPRRSAFTGRLSLHRLWPGLGDDQSVDLARFSHAAPATRHRRNGVAVA